jgi:aryl-alcohol dehydrogenase-like predicted oxidoreductase
VTPTTTAETLTIRPEEAWTGRRPLGARGPETSALGMGTWAIGGPWTFDGRAAGWGDVDDAVSIAAVHAAVAGGVRLFDSADIYGAGHSERVLGQALAQLPADSRDEIVVATKFGHVIDERTRTGGGTDVTPDAVRRACRASLRRLGVEAIDLYQLHGGISTAAEADDVIATLESLTDEGLVRWYGTSVDAVEVVDAFARAPHTVAVQTQVNVFGRGDAVLAAARRGGLAVLARSPLAMGLLTGSYDDVRRPPAGDIRRDTPWWDYFDDDTMPAWLERLAAVRELLMTGGRSLGQGSLGYLWGLDGAVLPIPGARTPAQATENAAALALGPLPRDVVEEVDRLLADSPERR